MHRPNQILYDFAAIRKEIEDETDRSTGKNKGISPIPINLKIYSPHVLNLTLVDLPGLTKVPVGDQPADIDRQIREMVYNFIEKPNAIILAVTPANVDMATSDALQMAREVDPQGLRTLGVITKIDLMDKGTDCMDTLLGKTYPLKLGFIGVINRSQQDISKNKDIKSSHAAETQFFSNHPLYRSINNRLGTQFLSKQLNKVLIHHIRDAIPELKMKVGRMMTDAQAEMQQYGDTFGGANGATLLNVITKFCQDYRAIIDGTSTQLRDGDDMFGGARVNYIFNDIFKRHITTIDPIEGLTAETIRLAIRNATGTRAALFIPEQAFEILVKKQIARLREPSLQCIGLVYDELQRIVSQVEGPELARFSVLRERLQEVVNELLRKCREPCMKMVHDQIHIELSYVNTSHPDFIGGGGALGKFFDRLSRTRQTEEFHRGEQLSQQQNPPPQQQNLLPSVDVREGQLSQTVTQMSTSMSQVAQSVTNNNPLQPQKGGPSNNPLASKSQQPGGGGGARPGQPPAAGGPGQGTFFSSFFGQQQGGAAPPHQSNASNPYAVQNAKTASGRPMQPQQDANNPFSSNTTTSTSTNSQAQQLQIQRQREEEERRRVEAEREAFAREEAERQKLARPSNMMRSTNVSDKDLFEAELIKDLMVSYFDIVRRNILDTVPKSIMYFLVNESKNRVQNELVATLYKEELFGELLEEGPQVASRRQACEKLLTVLKRAHTILNEVRDMPTDGTSSTNQTDSMFSSMRY